MAWRGSHLYARFLTHLASIFACHPQGLVTGNEHGKRPGHIFRELSVRSWKNAMAGHPGGLSEVRRGWQGSLLRRDAPGV